MFVVAQTPGGKYYWKHSEVKDYRKLPKRDAGMIRVQMHNSGQIASIDAAIISIDPYFPWERVVKWERGLPVTKMKIDFRNFYRSRCA